jgi:tetratricopeptide (TPR) repeat protein
LSDEERARLEAEATGQAAEADRLLKAGNYAAALTLYKAERTSRAALGDIRYEAYAIRGVGCCHAGLGELEAAIAAWREAQKLDAKRADRGFEGYDRVLIGEAQIRLGRTQEAIPTLREALPLLAQGADREHEADARLLLAEALREAGQPELGRPHLDRALELARALQDTLRTARARAALGQLALERGEAAQAADAFRNARSIYQEQGRVAEVALMDRFLGDALLELGQREAALACIEQAAKIHAEQHDSTGLGDDLEWLSAFKFTNNEFEAARKLAVQVVEARRKADDPIGEVEALVHLAHCQTRLGDWRTATETLNTALHLVRRDGQPADKVRLLILAADVARKTGSEGKASAATWLDEAQKIAQKANDPALVQAVTEARRRAH